MKVALGLLVVVVIGLFIAFKVGGVGGFDPAEQAKQLQAEVKPGVAWQQVVEKFPPKKMAAVILDPEGFLMDSAELKYDRAIVEQMIKDGGYKHGFKFIYIFDASNQFEVRFGEDFKVTSVDRMMTMDDLLNPR